MLTFSRLAPSVVALLIGAHILFSGEPPLSQLSVQERLSLALSLHDTFQSRRLLEELHKTCPEDPVTLKLHFEYLAELKDFEAIQTLYKRLSPEKKEALPPSVAEKVAWVVIEKALESAHPRIRAEAALAAAESQDIKGAHILSSLLTDSHQGVRSLAFQLAIPYRDSFIQERAEKLARSCITDLKVPAARLLAEQKAPSAEKILLDIVQDKSLSETDQLEVIRLIASCSEKNTSWIRQAATDPSPTTRALAAATFLEHPSSEASPFLTPLLSDNSLTVRKMAATSLGLYQGFVKDKESLLKAFSSLLDDPCLSLQATSAWALLLSSSAEHQKKASSWFQKNISSQSTDERNCRDVAATDDSITLHGQETISNRSAIEARSNCSNYSYSVPNLIAVSRLVRAGKYGLSLAHEMLSATTDPYVRLNLSLYLLLHKETSKEAMNEIRSACSSHILFGWKEDSFFSWVGPGNDHDPLIPRLPESEDLFFRLYLFALRHYSGDSVPKEELAEVLHDRSWGISAATAQFLFQEMLPLDEVLAPLLSHKEESIRVQAALLLAIFSRSQKAALTLLEEYQKASKTGKEMLLLGFGLLPANKTRSVLFPLLFDQSQTLRTRAAGVFLSSSYQ